MNNYFIFLLPNILFYIHCNIIHVYYYQFIYLLIIQNQYIIILQLKKQQMNELRLLQQIDPNKKIISLQFKQINSLQPMLPLLSKFPNLQSLSLHGNRLKNLPDDLSCLQQLTQLDISNNLFININQLITSLQTLPALTHLIMNFKNYEQQNLIKNNLPKLQRINKKQVVPKDMNINYQLLNLKKNYYQTPELSQEDLCNIGTLYDQIRDIYRNSKYFVDKQLADDFDRNVENIMTDLQSKLKNKESQIQKHCNILIGKYALIDICFVKIITFFYHFDKKIARSLQKIHDYQAQMFKNITDIIYSQLTKSKIQIAQIKLQKQQLFKTQIKRLKLYQDQSTKQIQYVQNKNKQLLDKLIKYSKSNIFQTSNNKYIQTPPISRSPTRQNKQYKQYKQDKQNCVYVYIKNKPKMLSYNQLKQIISQISISKQKHNVFSVQNHLPFQTMETHMYTYLNQKYGLKSLAIQWAMSIVNGIKKYGLQDPQIATFGKILRNQCDEQFFFVLHKTRQNLMQTVKKYKKTLTPRQTIYGQLTVSQSQQLLLLMHLKRQQVSSITSKLQQNTTNNLITIQKLQKLMLQHISKKHDEKISKIQKYFKSVDTDDDGIINIDELQKLMKIITPNNDIDKFIQILDPSKKGIIVFFYLCQLFLKLPQLKDFFKNQS